MEISTQKLSNGIVLTLRSPSDCKKPGDHFVPWLLWYQRNSAT